MGFKKRRPNPLLQGENHPRAKLTNATVRWLRRRKKEDGTINCSHWARVLGVSPQAVTFAVSGHTFKHVK